MNWLSRLLGFKDIVKPDFETVLGQSMEESRELFSETSKSLKSKNISEPVHAMVKSMFDRPHTWKIKRHDDVSALRCMHYDIRDIKTGLEFSVKRFLAYTESSYALSKLPWLTKDEEDYLISSLSAAYVLKMSRVKSIREVEKNLARNKVKDLYK